MTRLILKNADCLCRGLTGAPGDGGGGGVRRGAAAEGPGSNARAGAHTVPSPWLPFPDVTPSKSHNRTACRFLRLAHLTRRCAFKVPPCLLLDRRLISFLMIIFCCLDGPQVTLSPTEGRLGCSQLLAITNKAAINIRVPAFVWTWVFSFFG